MRPYGQTSEIIKSLEMSISSWCGSPVFMRTFPLNASLKRQPEEAAEESR